MLLLLLLLLISTIEVHSLSGCVLIGTVKGWKNLATEEIPHSNLRFVSAEVRDEKWLVEKSGDQLYKVLNPAWDEYLMILDAPMDAERSVFTIRKGTHVETDRWKFEKEGKHYIIRNAKYPGCLYVAKENYVHYKVLKKEKDCVRWEIKKCSKN